ncbi:MAG: BamA/TamA family outer membrane protein [Holophagales bacterium]|nr:BamA/TamA family outer membrane protein [Holophagales bacterium]
MSCRRPPPGSRRPSSTRPSRASGPFVEWDTRNNTLTPSSGVNVKASAMFLGSWLGGDNDFERYTGTARFYWDPSPRFVLAARLQGQGVSGDPPFYALPFISLKGIPVMRYQGETAASVDGEVRWNVWKRWWVVAFAGAGWTDDAPGLSKEGESVNAGGFGFRYLLARRLGLQAGIDVAKGPEEYAIYVVAGSLF